MSIREEINRISKRAGAEDLMPGEAADLLRTLASLLGNLNAYIRQVDLAYKKTLLKYYSQEETANRAKIVAETSQEYQKMREGRDTKELAIELMRSLKYFLKDFEEERRLSGHQ